MIDIDELVSIINRLCDKKDVKHELLFDRMCGKLILHLYENNYHIKQILNLGIRDCSLEYELEELINYMINKIRKEEHNNGLPIQRYNTV
jgi:hypothetical protein